MASIYRIGYKRDGEQRTLAKYYIKYKDANGQWQRVPGYESKELTKKLAARLEHEAATGVKPADSTPPLDLLEAYRVSLKAKGRDARYIREACNRIKAILVAGGYKRVADLVAYRVEAFIVKKGAATRNTYVANIKAFCNWLVENDILATSPMRHLSKLSENPVRIRRSLSPDEIAALLNAAVTGEPFKSFTGEARYMLYLAALNTGFRAQELASLTADSIKPGKIILAADAAKDGCEAHQPVKPEFENQIRAFAQGKTKLWPGKWYRKAAKYVYRDCKIAGVPITTTDGIIDFHAFRTTFITHLVLAGVHPKQTQLLARHSTMELTMKFYTRLKFDETAIAIGSLPTYGVHRVLPSQQENEGPSALQHRSPEEGLSGPHPRPKTARRVRGTRDGLEKGNGQAKG